MAHLGLGFEDDEVGDKDSKEVRKKLTVVGDGEVGKTCMLTSYVYDKFFETTEPTVFETYVKNIAMGKNLVQLALWDTAGQEAFDRLRPICYPDTDVLLVCFAVDNVNSLRNLKEIWIPEVKHFCPNVPFILVGTKTDLRNEKCVNCNGVIVKNSNTNEFTDIKECECKNKKLFVMKEDGEYVRERIGAELYMECSSKTREGIKEIFDAAAKLSLKKRKANSFGCNILSCFKSKSK